MCVHKRGLQVNSMLTFRSIREAYIAKDTVRENNTSATMS